MTPAEVCSLIHDRTVEEAQQAIEAAGLLFRIARRDSHPCILTRDYRVDRITLEIMDGKVIGARVG